MPRPASSDGMDKFKRYRASRRAGGLKLLRVWVPDPSLPGFREEARRQAALLREPPSKPTPWTSLRRTPTWATGPNETGEIVTVAVQGDYGKPRPAVVI